MRAMKDSGVEWIGEIPQNWEVKSIKQVYKFQTGWTPATSNETNFEGDNIWVNISDMKQRIIYDSAKHISDKAVAASSMNISPKGSLLYAFKLSVGAVAFCGKDLYTNEAIATFLPCENSLEYLFYAAPIFIIENANENIYGAKLLNQQLINNAKIVVPPIVEQQRIADYLDSKCSKIDSIIEKQQAVIEKLKEYKLSVITEAVTKGLNPEVEMKDSGVEWIGEVPEHWEVRKIKTLADVLPGYAFSSDDFSLEDGIALLRGINIIPNRVRWDDVVYWNKNDENILKTFSLKENDVVLGLDRPWIKEGTRVTVICENDLPCLLVQRVCRIRPLDNIDYRFVYHCLNGEFFKQSLSVETTGISIPHISTKQILNFAIAVPNIAEQSEICHYLEKRVACIENIIEKKIEAISKLQEYKKSLIYEVVTGKKEV